MQLFFQKHGQGPALIILHGLYGSSDNWVTIARKLTTEFTVYLVDLRNHGKSAHRPEHTFDDMAADIDELMVNEKLGQAILLGHSMGGKTAMLFASLHPEKVSKLVIVDIAPDGYTEMDNYSPHVISHLNIINTMLSVDMDLVSSRTAIEQQLENNIPDPATRLFIMKNILRTADNRFAWKLNIHALRDALPEMMGPVSLDKITHGKPVGNFPVLFLKGERSDYIREKHLTTIYKFFPQAIVKTIQDSGHWIHAEQPDLFFQALYAFIRA